MLENGDLIFVKESSDMGRAIQTSTGSYSHVAIFLEGLIYHASAEAGVSCQKPADFFESNRIYDLYVYPDIEPLRVKERACQHLEASYNASFYPDGDGFYCSQYIAEILPIFETIPMKFGDGDQEICITDTEKRPKIATISTKKRRPSINRIIPSPCISSQINSS